jgi:colanic acid/amylovoran biosynthesis protein
MNILLINLHSYRNIGDAAITRTTLTQLRNRFPGSAVILSAGDPDSHNHLEVNGVQDSFANWVRYLDKDNKRRWHLYAFPYNLFHSLFSVFVFRLTKKHCFITRDKSRRKLMQAYFNADLIISCGGGIFTTAHHWAIGPFWSTFSILYGALAGKPIAMFPQSVGPFANRFHRWLARLAYRQISELIPRDPLSHRELTELRTNKPIQLIPDVAFTLEPAPREAGKAWMVSKKIDLDFRPLIGLNLMNLGARFKKDRIQTDYENLLKSLVRVIIDQQKARIILFPHATGPEREEDDRPILLRFYQELNVPQNLFMIEDLPSPEILVAAYQSLDFFIATRMHAAIFAAMARTPFLALSYLQKAQGTFQLLDLASSVVDIQTTTSQELIHSYLQIWEDRKTIEEKLNLNVPVLKQWTDQVGTMIADNWRTQTGSL